MKYDEMLDKIAIDRYKIKYNDCNDTQKFVCLMDGDRLMAEYGE
jgi:hypothetical protein